MTKDLYVSPNSLYLVGAELAQQVFEDEFKPDYVVPVSPKARVLAHIVQSSLSGYGHPCNFINTYSDYQAVFDAEFNKRVLLVGRAMGTGESFKPLFDMFNSDDKTELKFACHLYFPNLNMDTYISPDYYADTMDEYHFTVYPEDFTFSDLVALFG